jgi:peptidoglycan LD-endopeptidase CwlK
VVEAVVLIVGIIVYFLLVVALLAFWLVPWFRERVSAGAQRTLQGGSALGAWWQTSRAQVRYDARQASAEVAAASVRSTWEELVHATRQGWQAHRRAALVGLAALVLVPGLALLARQWWTVDTYDHTHSRDVNAQVAALLEGEQLTAPLPLPPELFLTREVIQARPFVGGANRQWELLDAEFRQRLLAVFKLMRERHGLEMVLIEGYRSRERQAELAAMGPTVTHAAAGESWHQFGLAADSAFLIDGKVVVTETHPVAARGYALYGAVAQSLGLEWGGGWRSIKDLGHVELRRDTDATASRRR